MEDIDGVGYERVVIDFLSFGKRLKFLWSGYLEIESYEDEDYVRVYFRPERITLRDLLRELE